MLNDIKKILSPIDFSDFSIAAMKQAFELANETSAELHILHVVVPHHSLAPGEHFREVARESGLLEEAEEELARLKKDNLDDSKRVIHAVSVGAPMVKINEYARQQNIDLIILATHGRSGLEHMIIGSVAEKLVRTAPCSVMVLRSRSK